MEGIRTVVSRVGAGRVLLGGDFNAWSRWWGGERDDECGEGLAGMLEELRLTIINEGDESTFQVYRRGRTYTAVWT